MTTKLILGFNVATNNYNKLKPVSKKFTILYITHRNGFLLK